MSKGDKHIKRFHDFCINKTNVPADCVLENKNPLSLYLLKDGKNSRWMYYSSTAPKNIER